jgi:hypothetical protein
MPRKPALMFSIALPESAGFTEDSGVFCIILEFAMSYSFGHGKDDKMIVLLLHLIQNLLFFLSVTYLSGKIRSFAAATGKILPNVI